MNLGQIRTAVEDEGYSLDPAIENRMINAAYRKTVGVQRWPFLEKQDASLTTVRGTYGYTLPMADWLHLDAVRIEIAPLLQFYNVDYLPPQQFRDYQQLDGFDNTQSGTPFLWTWMNGQLYLYPTPDDAYTCRIDYISQPAALASDSDVPVIPLAYHDILVWGAVFSIAHRERDWLGRQFALEHYEQLLKRMQQEYLTRQRQSSSHVKRSGYNDVSMPYPFLHEGW